MNSNRSYLDTLNAGRPRRQYASLEDLNRSLEGFAAGAGGGEADEDIARRMERLSSRASRRGEPAAAAGYARGPRVESAEIERLFTAINDLADRTGGADLAGLEARLDDIRTALAGLPESLSLRSLDDKVKTLAAAIDHFARNAGGPQPGTFEAIEERLDEISRAIAASRPAGAEALERIEARITSLSKQVEELVEERPGEKVAHELTALALRVDAIAERVELPQKAVDRLGERINVILEKLGDGAPAISPEMILDGLERRFATLSDALERRQDDAREQGLALFRDLEVRLDDIAGQLARPERQNGIVDAEIFRRLEAQVAGLAEQLARPASPDGGLAALAPRLDTIERALMENREAIVQAAREAADQAVRSLSLPGADTEAIGGLAEDLQSLEELARHSDERNARTFEAIHDTLLKVVDRLALLESGAETAPSPRYALAEADEAEPAFAPEPRREPEMAGAMAARSVAEAPSLDLGEAPALPVAPRREAAQPALPEATPEPKRSPSEAASAAALAALGSDTIDAAGKPSARRSLLGGLKRGLKSKAKRQASGEPARAAETPALEAGEPVVAVDAAPAVDLDAPLDPRIANQPLEPGSGTPDLNAIMKRVRGERAGHTRGGETDAAHADFIAAARRAAQAAGAEANLQKKKADKKGAGSGFSLKKLLRANSKAVVLAGGVALVALAGAELGKALLADGGAGLAGTGPAAVQDATVKDAKAKADPDAQALIAQALARDADGDAPEKMAAGQDAQATSAPAADMPPVRQAVAAPEAGPAEAEAADPHTASAAAAVDGKQAAAVAPSPETTGSIPPAAGGETRAAHSAPTLSADVGPLALRQAADAGDAKAMYEIGARHADAEGAGRDMAAAARWFGRAAAEGLAPAQFRLGNLYENGQGVERDLGAAKIWYGKAAAQGNASAMHNLAVLLAMGASTEADNREAAGWFTKAAEFGVRDSQYNLGILAAKGIGMPQDLEESYKWFDLVAKAGDKDAAAKRDEVAKALQPEQLQKARAAAALWKAKPMDAAANAVDLPEAWKDAPQKTASVDMKQAVRNIQIILNKNGYQTGTPDGVMGERTKGAIAAFQKANGMAPTGEVDEALVTALLQRK